MGYTGHVMTFEVGAVLEDANWQAPVNCFDENDKEKNIPILGSAVRGGSLGSYDIGSATWADLRKAPLQSAMEVTYICVHFVLKELVRKSISETEVSNVPAMFSEMEVNFSAPLFETKYASALESGSFHSPVDEKLILKFVVEEMLIGHADHISESRSLKDQILGYSGSELSDDEEEDCLEQILYSTSFEELASNYVKYDTMIVTEASKITQDVSTSGKHAGPSTDEENICQEQLRDQLF
ncbi:Uncharacterized protein HKD37_19G052830 [Glycine soja]